MPNCNNCGSTVTARFCRVFGNNDDEVCGCPHCKSGSEIIAGVAEGVDPTGPYGNEQLGVLGVGAN